MNGKRLSLAAVMALSLLSLFGLESCSKNNSSSYQTDGTLTATVNGSAYSAKSYVVAGYLSSYDYILVQGDSITGSDTTMLQLTIPYLLPVNQAISIDSSAYLGTLGLTYQTGSKQYSAYYAFLNSHGTITLTTADTVNHRLIGTFSGVLYNNSNGNDSVVVTNGAFNSIYQVQ